MNNMKSIGAGLLLLAGMAAEAQTDWPTYGHDAGGMRYSPLKELTPANVDELAVAWTYHMRPREAAAQSFLRRQEPATADTTNPRRGNVFLSSQVTPLVVGNVMYLSTPYQRVVALDATTGQELWVYDVPKGIGAASRRGVEYWRGTRKLAPRIFFGTRDGKLIALDARTGAPIADFGTNGIVDMKTPEITGGNAQVQYGMSSPPTVYKNLVITGSATQEQPARGAYGDVRAWDAITGELVWTFHSVPRPGEPGHDTWEGDSWRNRSGVNVWAFMTVDAKRGIVYMPFGAPTYDRYGGDRKGMNLYSSSIVAADANTGKYLWHFQTVHHDIWDFDTQAPPVLLDVKKDGRTEPAVVIVSKTGMMFILNRVTGKPLYPIEERPVPPSEVPEESAWPTQPFPTKPAPFARQSFTMNDIATVTPELEKYCRDFIAKHDLRMGEPYLPIGLKPTISFPGRQGGANWGGGSYDPTLGLFFVNANNLGQVEQISRNAEGMVTNDGPATGRFSERRQRLMCQQPPWGTLTAINVHSGDTVWQVPFGVSDVLPPAVAKTGRPSSGGSIATAGGLLFIGATDDNRFRAFESKTGRELWEHKLPASAHAVPITYRGKDKKQYVVIMSTGGSLVESPVESDAVTAFALGGETYEARLSPLGVTNATVDTTTGAGNVTATLTGTRLHLEATFEGLTGAATQANLRRGPKGIPGPVVFELEVPKASAGTLSTTLELTRKQVSDLRASRLYLQIHSERAPEGSIRGWLLVAKP